MDFEASVVERLQKLRRWQLEQQERLLKQQQMQREMLTQRQDSIYKALELSIQECDLNEDKLIPNNIGKTIESTEINNENLIKLYESQTGENCIQILNNNELCDNQNINSSNENVVIHQKSSKDTFTENHIKRQSENKTVSDTKNEIELTVTSPKEDKCAQQFIVEGVASLPPDKTVINHISIDDVPIPSPRKDFHTLLKEKLKDSENEPLDRSNATSGSKVKRPFLKKGEGLSRFRLHRQSQLSSPKLRSYSTSFTNTQSNSKCCKSESTFNKTAQHLKSTQLLKRAYCTNVARKHLSLKNVSLPKKKVRSKSESNTLVTHLEDCISEVKNPAELNTLDFHSGTQKELEEVRIFELLEEKAENSSFCSTSSAVVAFLQQSTPFKIKNAEYKRNHNICNAKQGTPVTKVPKNQSGLKSNQYKCNQVSNNKFDTCCNLPSFMNHNLIQNNLYKNVKLMQDINENSPTKVNENRHILLSNQISNQIQSVQNQQNLCNEPAVDDDNNVDVSFHVRFSEYNEYKTIGLTDTSSMSTESSVTKGFSDEKAWSDSSITDMSTLSMPFEVPQSFIAKNKTDELNYKMASCEDTRQNDNSTCNINYHKDKSEFSDTTDKIYNNEENSLLDYSQDDTISQEINNSDNIEISKEHKEKYNNNCDDVVVIKDQEQHERNLRETNETVFQSELLKNRLLELEQEINIFRKENVALSSQRKKLQEDYKNLRKDYAEKEKNFEENRKQVEDYLQEERKKLAREKAALENRMRDSQEKAQQSRLERQEIQNLKQEVEKLMEEMHIKESRWNAAQSRCKCQMRILKMENSKLKQEVERLQNLKKNSVRNKGRSGTSSNTRAIHQINKQLNMQIKESQKINDISSDDDQKLIEPMMKASIIDDENIEEDTNSSKNVMNEKLQRSQSAVINIAKKRNLYENLIKDATFNLRESGELFNSSENLSKFKSDIDDKLEKLDSKTNTVRDNYEKSDKNCDTPFNNDNISCNIENDYTCFISPTETYHENYEKISTFVPSGELVSSHIENSPSSCQNKTAIDKQDIKQIKHVDGSIEYRFPNGNIKKVFPDKGITKLIYYNGDVRETNIDGKVRYFYASTRTWHTTMPDGLEVLEFPDGQTERRSHNGMVEVSFPDGSVRILESNGTEKWTLPDGTLIQILTNGEKVLTLPNGQREVHTKTHKRREYPDGTIKLIHLDGTQETRYSNGRVRLKDKDGNLLMDSYQ
ncbi:spindle assembly abnormal 4 [Xylocopa sonorina]|uniref:spindle assembly abnormal 4 n=1 Tax=Xylocopa sonorina TaxID=1818115 RepID=UPI00403B2EA5